MKIVSFQKIDFEQNALSFEENKVSNQGFLSLQNKQTTK
jgi:hypothetical protein